MTRRLPMWRPVNSSRIREVSFALDEFEKDIDGYNRKLQEALYGH